MDLSYYPTSVSLASQNEDTFNVTITTSLRHPGFTSGARTEQGCLILQDSINPEDNPENVVSKQLHFWVSTISNAVIIPILFLMGLPGNVLTAAVFYRLGLRERINFCIFFLALVDFADIIVVLGLRIEIIYRFLVGPSNFFIKYFLGLTGFSWVSMFLSSVIAAERCFCVVSPLRAQRMVSTRTLAVVVVSISLLILTGMLVIAGPKHTEVCVFDTHTNSTSLVVDVTDYYKENKAILDIFDRILYGGVLTAFFFIFIVVTTIITSVKLRSAYKWRQQSSSVAPSANSSDSQTVALTWMLVATSVLFVVCTSPVVLVQIAAFLVPGLGSGGRYYNLWGILWTVIAVSLFANSSLNFFVYYKMGSRFRKTLKQLLCGKEMDVSDSSTPVR